MWDFVSCEFNQPQLAQQVWKRKPSAVVPSEEGATPPPDKGLPALLGLSVRKVHNKIFKETSSMFSLTSLAFK